MKPQILETNDDERIVAPTATPLEAQRGTGTMRTRFNGQKNVVHEVQKMNEDTKK